MYFSISACIYTAVSVGHCMYRVATIGYHVIYKIVDTYMVRVFSTQPRSQSNAIESKLVDNSTTENSFKVGVLL